MHGSVTKYAHRAGLTGGLACSRSDDSCQLLDEDPRRLSPEIRWGRSGFWFVYRRLHDIRAGEADVAR